MKPLLLALLAASAVLASELPAPELIADCFIENLECTTQADNSPEVRTGLIEPSRDGGYAGGETHLAWPVGVPVSSLETEESTAAARPIEQVQQYFPSHPAPPPAVCPEPATWVGLAIGFALLVPFRPQRKVGA